MNTLDHLLLNLLNLTLDDIDDISSSLCNEGMTVHVTLKKPKIHSCPFCNSARIQSKGYYDKAIKLNNKAFENIIVKVRVPRRWCISCNHTISDTKHMNPNGYTISYDVIQNVMKLLKSEQMTFANCARITGLSESSVVHIFDKHCHINRSTLPEVLCIDEVYTKATDFKDNGHYAKFSCLLYDFHKNQLVDVLPSRSKAYLHHYFHNISKPELSGVKYVVIDMYKTYKDIARIYLKNAAICVDSFHVIKHLNDGLSKLRIRIMNKYDLDSLEYYLLKKFNFLLHHRNIDLNNKAKFNHKLARYVNYQQLLDLLLSIDPVLAQAWHLKEIYTEFNATCKYEDARQRLDGIIESFFHANIGEYREFSKLILNWREEIVNSFTISKGRRVNNGIAESINNKVSSLIYNTRGIRNNQRRRKRIMYAINKEGFLLK